MSSTKKNVYSDEEVQAKLQQPELKGWYLEEGWIRRKYNTEGWPITLMLVNAIGFLCEAANHHADLTVTYAKVWVRLKTHSSGGITDNDLALAHKIEEFALWRPPQGGALEGPPGKFVYSQD